MKRGDVVLVALPGGLGKPRPAILVQSDRLRESATVLLCPVTSEMESLQGVRPAMMPSPGNGLQLPSRAMVDKLTVAFREKCRGPVGALSRQDMILLDGAVAFVLGLAES